MLGQFCNILETLQRGIRAQFERMRRKEDVNVLKVQSTFKQALFLCVHALKASIKVPAVLKEPGVRSHKEETMLA